MDRRSFLRRALVGIGAVTLGRLPAAAPAAAAPAVEFENGWANAGAESLVSSGGLCAPLTPYYSLASIDVASGRVIETFPITSVSRGGVLFGVER